MVEGITASSVCQDFGGGDPWAISLKEKKNKMLDGSAGEGVVVGHVNHQ